jgi:hypothetical protein
VFKDAVVDTQTLIIERTNDVTQNSIAISFYDSNEFLSSHQVQQESWVNKKGSPINILQKASYDSFVSKIEKHPVLDKHYLVTQGTKPFQVGKGNPKQTQQIVDEKPFVSIDKKDNTFVPLLRGNMMNKYEISWNKNYWIKFGEWLAEPRHSANFFINEKIVVRQTGDSIIATIDTQKFVVRDNLYTIVQRVLNDKHDLKFLLGILNCQLMNWYYQTILNPEVGEILAQVKRTHLANIPIVDVDFKNKTQKQQHDTIVNCVTQLLTAKQKLSEAKTEKDKNFLEHQCQSLDTQIDEEVYKLYGLLPEEIKIVEGVK